MEKELKELELEKAEYREFLKGLMEKKAEEEKQVEEEPVVVENEGEKEKKNRYRNADRTSDHNCFVLFFV